MAVDDKLGQKSRRELRKEARLAKNRKKFDSWVEHQKYRKLQKSSGDPNPVNMRESKNSIIQSATEKVATTDLGYEGHHEFEQPSMLECREVKLDSMEIPDCTASKVIIKRSKRLMKDPKSKFQEHLDLEMQKDSVDIKFEKKLAKKLQVKDGKLGGIDDGIDMLLEGIPSVVDFFKHVPEPLPEQILKRSYDHSSSKTSNKSMPLEKDPEGGSGMAGKTVVGLSKPVQTCSGEFESTDHPNKLKKYKIKKDSSINPDSVAVKMEKRRKTKFEEYVEMEMQEGVVSAESDLYLERKLAKKLKVTDGKLRGDDEINLLIEGIPSAFDYFDASLNKGSEDVSLHKNHKKVNSSERGLQSEMAGDPVAVVSEPAETLSADVAPEKEPAKASEMVGNAKYIAPHLRSRLGNESEQDTQIRRRVRGLLNRLSESNVESVTGEISTIFRSVARGVGSQIITEEILASCSGGPRGNEQYAAVFAAFVAGMSCLVGIDFGAKLLASLAKCFEDEYLEEDNLSLRNLTLLLSYLYIFGVCSSDLIYDFIIMLSKRLMEIDVSTILTILQHCGMNLRGDDPAAMKDFVFSVQKKANELKASSENGRPNTSGRRMEFMLETICDIKNNKKRAKEDTPQHTRMKKWLQKNLPQMKSQHPTASYALREQLLATQLKVEDILIRGLKWSKLLDPDKKGQWWFSGDMASTTSNVKEVASTIDRESLEAQKLLQLAAAQRMNTDVRRGIFCIIMSGEDYVDAFEKLLRLNLQGKQDREIIRVLVECCLQEKVFNKYYSLLATKLCSHDNKLRTTLQYCLWDHFKELESMQLMRSSHLSNFVAEMIASFTLSLAALKVVDFSDTMQLTNKKIVHFRMLFKAIFEHSDKVVWNVFTRIAANPELESLRNGIEFFINEYIVNVEKQLARKFKIAKKALANVEGVLM